MVDGNPLYDNVWQALNAKPAGGMVAPPSQNGFFGSALSGGYHEALGQLASAAKGAGTLMGSTALAQWGGDAAKAQQAAAAASENPDWEKTSVFSPQGLAYRVAKGMPGMVPVLGGAFAGGAAGTAIAGPPGAAIGGVLGGALAAYPQMFGGNVQTAEQTSGKDVTQGEAAKAAALGVPMAAIGALPAERLFGTVAKGVAEPLWKAASKQAGAQAIAGAGQDFIGQQMGDPDRPIAARAQQMVEAALTGGAMGGVLGGGLHMLAKKPVPEITNEDLKTSVKNALDPANKPQVAGLLTAPQMNLNAKRPYEGLSNQELLAQKRTLQTRDANHPGLLDVAREMELRRSPPEAGPNPDVALQQAWQDKTGLTNEAERVLPGSESDRLESAWTVAPRAVQPMLGLPSPEMLRMPRGPEEPVHEPSVVTVPTRGTDGEIILNDQSEQTPTRAPIELGQTHQGEPVAEPQGPLGLPAPTKEAERAQETIERSKDPVNEPLGPNRLLSGEVPKMPDRSAILPQTIAKTAMDANDGKLPAILRGAAKLTPEGAEAVIRADWADKTPNERLKDRLMPVARLLDMVDEAGNLNAPKGAPSIREAVPEQHQARFDKLEDLKAAVPEADKKGVEDAQVALASGVGRGEASVLDAEIKALQKAADEAHASAQRAAAREPAAIAQPAPPAEAPTEAKPGEAQPAAPAPIAQEPAPSPAATAKVDQLIQQTRGVEKNPSGEPAQPGAVARFERLAAGVLKGKETPAPYQSIRDAIAKVRASDETMKNLAPSETPDHPGHDGYMRDQWAGALAEQRQKLDHVERMLNENPEALRELSGDHFYGKLWDDLYAYTSNKYPHGRLQAEAERAAEAHSELEQRVLAAVRRELPPDQNDWFARGDAPADRNQMDVDLTGIIQAGGSAKEALGHIVQNSADPASRVVAKLLLDKGVNSGIAFRSLASEARSRGEWPPRGQEDGRTLAKYIPMIDGIRLYARAGLEHTVLHEAVHAASLDALGSEGPAAKAFKGLFDTVKKRFPDETHYGLTNAEEFLAEGFTNSRFKDWMANQSEAGRSLWQRFKDGVASLLGWGGGRKTLLDQVMEKGRAVFDENNSYEHTPAGQDAALKPAFLKLDEMRDRVSEMPVEHLTNLLPKLRGTVLGWVNSQTIAKWYGKFSPAMLGHTENLEWRDLMKEVNTKAASAAVDRIAALPAASQEKFNKLTTGLNTGLNGMLDWSAHKDLFDAPNARELGESHKRLQQLWKSMSDEERGAFQGVVTAQRAHMEQLFATQLYNFVKSDYAEKIPLPPGVDPSEQFRLNPTLHDDPAQNLAFWKSAGDQLTKLAQNHIDTIDGAVAKLKGVKADATSPDAGVITKRAESLNDSISPLRSLLNDRATRLGELDRLPNFPMGRQGEFFSAAKLALGDDGRAPQKNVDKLQKMLNAGGFGHLTIDRNLENPTVYARVETPGQMERLNKIFQTAHDQGVFEPKSLSSGSIATLKAGITPQWQERAMQIMRSNLERFGADDPLIQQRIAEAKREFLDMLPPSSLNRIMARREGVQGFSREMLQNVRQRMTATSGALANMAAMPRLAESVVKMREDVDAANRANAPERLGLHQAAQELIRREAQRAVAAPGAPMQALREIGNAMEVGASPGYTVALLSQVGTLTLPRLGAAGGYMNAAKAMAGVTKRTFDVLRAVAGGTDGLRFGMREADLLKAGVPKRDVEFLMRMDAMGAFNHGSYQEAMRADRGDPDSALGKARGWAQAMGRYSEMMPRVLTALAARDMWEKSPKLQAHESVHDFAHRMVEDSQLNWNPTFNARQMTRGGVFGPMSPLINQFMGYSTRLTEMLYREAANAIGREGPAAQAEARKFLLGHLAVTGVLAGSLGMPMAQVINAVWDRMADWATNRDDHDITASYRSYLAHVFGKDVGEIIARGVPRAFGIDLSHLGDQRIAPGSTALTYLMEKRKLEDAQRDWLKAEAGHSFGLVGNFAFAARDIANGDYLNGAQKLVPDILRGPVEATRLGLYGYRDKSGMAQAVHPDMPAGTATMGDMIKTAIGLDPAEEEDFAEKKRTITGLNTMAQVREQNITQHMSLALTRGDTENFGYWINQAIQYQQDHPGMPGPLEGFSGYMNQHYSRAAMAGAMGLPVGLSPKNIVGRGMLDY